MDLGVIDMNVKAILQKKYDEAKERYHKLDEELCQLDIEIEDLVDAINAYERYVEPLHCQHCDGAGVILTMRGAPEVCGYCDGTGVAQVSVEGLM